MAAHPNGVAVPARGEALRPSRGRLDKCDMLDGVKDGLLENPTRCTFDPKEIECRAGDGPDCLTPPQVEAVRKIYAGPDQSTDERARLVAALSRQRTGLELLHRVGRADRHRDEHAARRDSQGSGLGLPHDARRLRPPRRDGRRSDIARVSASNPDISPFVRQGGKLILSGGWNNALVPAGAVLDYYQRVQATIGREHTRAPYASTWCRA